MKTLIAALALATAPFTAFAMPEGSLDCASKDNKWTATFIILNYGEPELIRIDDMTLDGKTEPTNLVQISRQWVDNDIAKIDVALPNGSKFSRNLIIETKASAPGAYDYVGTIRIEERADDYSSPEKVAMKTDMTCVYNP